jgi:hypothetical protein
MKVLFSKRRGFNIPSLFFRWVDNSDFSHAAILVETPYGSLVIESNHLGVHATSFRSFVNKNEIVKMIHLTPTVEQKIIIMETLYRLLGVGYGFLTVFGAGIARVFKLTKNIFSDGDKTEFCSEFAYDVLDDAYNLTGFKAELDGPKKLYEILKCLQEKGL